MKVYVVTAGEYSDYHIEKIFSKREDANLYALLACDRMVEEFTMDDVEIKTPKKFMNITYNYRWNRIEGIELVSKQILPRVDQYHFFEFTIPLSNERVYKNILRYGKKSGLVFRITKDKFAEYLYEHDTTVDELIRKEEEKFRNENDYIMYKTSADVKLDGDSLFNPYLEADNKVTLILTQIAINKEPFPEPDELKKLYDKTLEEVKRKHESE